MGKSVLGLALALTTWLAVPPAPAAPSCIPREKCCKVCDGGQACGNSCISRSKQCHKGRGRSCNLAEVCATAP